MVGGGAVGGHEDEDIADGPGEDTATGHGFGDAEAGLGFEGIGLSGRTMGDQFDTGDQAGLADIADGGEVPEVLEFEGQEGFEGGAVLDASGVLEKVEGGEAGSAAEGVAGEAMAVEEGFEVGVVAEEGVEDGLGGEGGGQGEVAAGETFGEAEEIGLDRFVMGGEEPVFLGGTEAGAAEAGHDFVGDDEGAMGAGEGGGALEPAIGLGEDAGGALESGFDDEGGVGAFLALGAVEGLFDMIDAFPVALAVGTGVGGLGGGAVVGAAVAIGGHDGVGGEEQAAVGAMEEVDMAEGDGADGIAVVGALEGEEAGKGDGAGAAGVFPGQFEGHLEGGGTVVGVEDLGETGLGGGGAAGEAGGLDQAGGELGGRFAGETEGGAMGDAVELAAEGAVEVGLAVAVEVGPDGGVGIEVGMAVGIAEGGAAAGHDDAGFGAQPILHLGEGMPDVAVIQMGEGMHDD